MLTAPIRITEHNWPKDMPPMVSVSVLTYNHENYIAQCIEGILSQKTTFPVRICIFEDCSSDNTATIVKEYSLKFPQIIFEFCQNINTFRKPERKDLMIPFKTLLNQAKYIANCEGDDYWIHEYKLQEQVTFLESHPGYSMHYARAKQYVQKNNTFLKKNVGKKTSSLYELLNKSSTIPTLTACYRVKDELKYIENIKPFTKKWLMGDLPRWLYFLSYSKIHFSKKITAVYRILEESVSNTNNLDKHIIFNRSSYEVRAFFGKLNGISIRPFNEHSIVLDFYIKLSKKGLTEEDRKKAKISFYKIQNPSIKQRIFRLLLSNNNLLKFFNALR